MTSSRAGRFRRVASLALAGAVIGGLTAAVPTSSQAATWITNPNFTSSTKGWNPGSNDKISRWTQAGSPPAGRVRGTSTTRTQEVAAGSSLSPSTTSAGSKVHAKVYLRTSAPSRAITFTLYEMNRGKVVQAKTTRGKSRGTSWSWEGVDLTTRLDGSSVRVRVAAASMPAWKSLLFRNVGIAVTPAPATPAPAAPAPTTPAPTPSASPDPTPTPTPSASAPAPTPTAPAPTVAPLSLGNGLLNEWNSAKVWALNNRSDSRWDVINSRVASQPDSMWILGDHHGVRNLTTTTGRAKEQDRTAVVVLYNIPKRNDGLSGPQGASGEADYRAWIDQVAAITKDTRVLFVVEPDALWFVDRQTPPGTAAYTERINSLRYAVSTLSALPNARVYVEAGTSSRSITPRRMAELLKTVGASNKVGYAVNVSSFGPEKEITAWATEIRDALIGLGVSNPRYLVDTSRNGNPSWPAPHEWCNPVGRKLGLNPGLVNSPTGRDANLWIKGPGTSDGSCGVGVGTYGGELMPQVAYDMAK